ncbi:MAG: hypothetical protein U0641_06200 [Anaerolineae bacterium]
MYERPHVRSTTVTDCGVGGEAARDLVRGCLVGLDVHVVWLQRHALERQPDAAPVMTQNVGSAASSRHCLRPRFAVA